MSTLQVGCYHVFQGGGDDPNSDYVSDIPSQSTETSGCRGGGQDLVNVSSIPAITQELIAPPGLWPNAAPCSPASLRSGMLTSELELHGLL